MFYFKPLAKCFNWNFKNGLFSYLVFSTLDDKLAKFCKDKLLFNPCVLEVSLFDVLYKSWSVLRFFNKSYTEFWVESLRCIDYLFLGINVLG
jgi:hypothetical protein